MTKAEQLTTRTAALLANAGDQAVAIIGSIAGNDISTAIGGSKISNEVLQSLLYQRIYKNLTARATVS